MYINSEFKTQFMCIRSDVFLELCELYPATHANLRELALHKREIYMHFLETVKQMKKNCIHSGVPRGIDSRRGQSRNRSKQFGKNAIQLSDDDSNKSVDKSEVKLDKENGDDDADVDIKKQFSSLQADEEEKEDEEKSDTSDLEIAKKKMCAILNEMGN